MSGCFQILQRFGMFICLPIALILLGTGISYTQSLQFNQVILNNGGTVPQGCVWKIEDVLMDPIVSVKYTASSGNGTCTSCNGGTTRWTSYSTSNLPVTSMYGIVINGVNHLNVTLPLWIPEGTAVAAKGPIEDAFSLGGSYGPSCICPPAAFSVNGKLSIIEFKVVP
jgi:hypothetical protein